MNIFFDPGDPNKFDCAPFVDKKAFEATAFHSVVVEPIDYFTVRPGDVVTISNSFNMEGNDATKGTLTIKGAKTACLIIEFGLVVPTQGNQTVRLVLGKYKRMPDPMGLKAISFSDDSTPNQGSDDQRRVKNLQVYSKRWVFDGNLNW